MTQHPTPRRPDVATVELVGGPEALEIDLHEYDDRWVEVYLEHRRRILETLDGVEAEHIGSTSVPGLAAKPIVDIVVAVDDITAEEDYLDALLGLGYVLRVREPGHRLVRTPARDVHVHIYQRHDPAIDAYLLLRDRLRSDADDRALYESTKRALLTRRWDDMNAYSDAKSEVIAAINERARAARPILRPGTASDVDACVALWVGACAARDGVRIAGVAERARPKFDRRVAWVIAQRGDDIVGFVLATEPGTGAETDPPDAVVIGLIAVDPSAQRSGVGARLLDAVTTELAHLGHRLAVLHVLTTNAAAVRLYESHGWVATGPTFEHTLLQKPFQPYLRDLRPGLDR